MRLAGYSEWWNDRSAADIGSTIATRGRRAGDRAVERVARRGARGREARAPGARRPRAADARAHAPRAARRRARGARADGHRRALLAPAAGAALRARGADGR